MRLRQHLVDGGLDPVALGEVTRPNGALENAQPLAQEACLGDRACRLT